jgi:hypothetical protein
MVLTIKVSRSQMGKETFPFWVEKEFSAGHQTGEVALAARPSVLGSPRSIRLSWDQEETKSLLPR